MNHKIHEFINQCCELNLSIALAESVTCGFASHQLATSPGTSDIFKGSVICYSEQVKTSLLGVSNDVIRKNTAESMIVTTLLAKGLRKIIEADVHAAITGLASEKETASKQKPVGTVFFCVLYGGRTYKQKKVFRGTPLQIRKKASTALFDLISRKIFVKNKKR